MDAGPLPDTWTESVWSCSFRVTAPRGVEPLTEQFVAATALFELDPESVRCPYPIFAALREQAPVAWFDELDAFVVTQYDLIVDVLRQPDRFSSRNTTGPVADRQIGR